MSLRKGIGFCQQSAVNLERLAFYFEKLEEGEDE